MSKLLISAILVPFALAAACGDANPGDVAPQPASGGAEGGIAMEAGSPAQLLGGDASLAADAPPDRDPGFRDPHAPEAGCTAPNKVCPTQDPDAGPDAGPVCVAIGTDEQNCGDC